MAAANLKNQISAISQQQYDRSAPNSAEGEGGRRRGKRGRLTTLTTGNG